MDEFAQTREADDLFDDDFTPITEPVQQNIPSYPTQAQRGRNDRPNRSQGKPTPNKPNQTDPQETSNLNPTTTTADPNFTPTVDPEPFPKSPTAVRGDRSATGGPPKPKLTESELSAKLAAAKLNNARREEAHRLAEADEASFQQREAQASQKRREEGQARRVMDQERERNRLRKLGARGGREWDEGKEEPGPGREGGSQYRRGAHGGVSSGAAHDEYKIRGRGGGHRDGYRVSEPPIEDEPQREFILRGGRGRGYRDRGDRGRGDRGRGDRGRGDRGGRGSRTGRGRGGYDGGNRIHDSGAPVITAEKEFPSLPTGTAPNNNPKSAPESKPSDQSETKQPATASTPKNADILQSHTLVGESWADQVEAVKVPESGW